MTVSNPLAELAARGLIQDSTDRDELGKLLAGESVVFYAGYDPTAASLHAGNLVPIVLQARLQQAGHRPIMVVGGATGMVGDPSGKSAERQLLDVDRIAANVAAVRAQVGRFLDFGDHPGGARVVDNHDWLGAMSFLGFLRDVGKHLSINYMIAKESVRARLEDREQGISYTEFSYMLLQAYDFVHLARSHGCRLQVGGSDQWGNITAGIELARRMGGCPPLHGLTVPLLVDASGEKMGKTAAGTKMWLDAGLTSPYAFYQYWINVDDRDVARLLRIFAWRPVDEVEAICAEHAAAPDRRGAQKVLAEEITRWVHGGDATRRAIAASQVMFGGALDDLHDADLEPLLADLPSSTVSADELGGGIPLVDLLARTGLAQSKGAARRLVAQGGVYVNNQRVSDAARTLTSADLGTETMIVLRAGKKSYHLVRVG